MRCKKHPIDLTSTVGVCATCLRERLFALIEVQAEAEAQAHARAHSPAQLQVAENRFHTQLQPPPLIFPRSVSPYVTRRKSDDPDSWAQDNQYRRFYSTPQIGPKLGEFSNYGDYNKKKHSKFSLLKSFFRSRSGKRNSDLAPDLDSRVSSQRDRNFHRDSYEASASSSSPSWFSFLPRRSKDSRPSVENFASLAGGGRSRKPSRISNRGMSPERGGESEDNCGYDQSPSASGYTSSAAGVTPAHVRRTARGGHSRNASGLAFCLSPLVRASPSRLHHQKSDIGYSGELRIPAKPNLSTAASFCGNRSRKLVDFGRANNHNH